MSLFPDPHAKDPLFPICEFKGHARHDCINVTMSVPTPLGQCYTINARGEFGNVALVGEQHGLTIGVDQGPLMASGSNFLADDVSEVKVNSRVDLM